MIDTKKLITTILATVAMSMMLIACHPSYVNAQNELETLLNSEEGQKMTADQLAEMTPDRCQNQPNSMSPPRQVVV